MTTPQETPKEHVHESVGRQEAAAQNVKRTARRVAKTAADKAEVLAAATEILSARVQTLADVVQINNEAIGALKREVDQKPDDTELQFIAGLARQERKRHLWYAISTALIAMTIGGYTSYTVADYSGTQRCKVNAQNIETLVGILDTPQLRKQYAAQIKDLRSNRNICE